MYFLPLKWWYLSLQNKTNCLSRAVNKLCALQHRSCHHPLCLPRHLASPTVITGCRTKKHNSKFTSSWTKSRFPFLLACNLLCMETIIFRHIPWALSHINETVGGLEDCNPLSIILQRVTCIRIMFYVYYLFKITQKTDEASYFSWQQKPIKVSSVTFII